MSFCIYSHTPQFYVHINLVLLNSTVKLAQHNSRREKKWTISLNHSACKFWNKLKSLVPTINELLLAECTVEACAHIFGLCFAGDRSARVCANLFVSPDYFKRNCSDGTE